MRAPATSWTVPTGATLPLRFVVALSLVVSLGGACKSGSSAADAGTRNVISCNTDEECGAFVCDKARRQCVCTTDDMCQAAARGAAAAFCNAFTGACVTGDQIAGCKSATDCTKDQFCDVAVRTCKPKRAYCETCTRDAECGATSKCARHPDYTATDPFCMTPCGTADACPSGQKCRDTEKGKACVPEGQCNADPTCVPDSFQLCSADADCTQGTSQRCNLAEGRCVASVVSICVSGQSCDPRTNHCVAACAADADCVARFGANFLCVQASCRPSNACTSHDQCAPSEFCLKAAGAGPSTAGICKPSCSDTSQCPIGTQCAKDAATQHFVCQTSCSGDSDCLFNQYCESGTCQPGCQINDVCAFRERCTNHQCVADSKHCQTCNTGCSGGLCGTIGTSDVCVPATQQCPACPSGATAIRAGPAGSSCSPQVECICTIKRCLYPCSDQQDPSQCPKGFTCEDSAPDGIHQGLYCNPSGSGALCQ